MSFEPEDPWLKEDGEASDKPLDNVVLVRMKQLRAMNKMKKLALKVTHMNIINYQGFRCQLLMLQ